MIVELMRATVRSGERFFHKDRSMFECMAKFGILELTKVFMFKTLWNVWGGGVSKVRPKHYMTLLQLIIGANSFADFIVKTEKPGSVWTRVSEWDSIHEGVLDKELRAVGKIADSRASVKSLHMFMARLYKLSGLLPHPDAFQPPLRPRWSTLQPLYS